MNHFSRDEKGMSASLVILSIAETCAIIILI